MTIPAPKKIIIWLVIAAVIIILINQALKLISKAAAAKDAAALRNDLNSSNLSYDLTQYGILADKLEASIGAWTTDESAVYSVFDKMQSTDDVKQLIKSFGTRTFTMLNSGLTLPQYVAAGMSSSEIEKINKSLEDRGINISI